MHSYVMFDPDNMQTLFQGAVYASRFQGFSPFIWKNKVLVNPISSHLKELLNEPPRMVDFAITGEAVAKALGMEEGSFLRAFSGSQIDSNMDIVDASPIGNPVRKLISDKSTWTGKSNDLLLELGYNVSDEVKRRKDWPKDAARMGRTMRTLAPSFRAEDINVDFDTPSRRYITISKIE